MDKKTLIRAMQLLCAAAILAGVGYLAGYRHGLLAGSTPGADAGTTAGDDRKAGPKVLYWHDPMVPNQHFDKPGKSPFMDMQLEPVYADQDSAAPGVKIDPAVQHGLGIRYAKVRRQEVRQTFDAIGTTQYDESRTDVVQSRVTGYIERLYASAPMQRIGKGEPVAALFVPDWLAPQEEYLALRRSGMGTDMLEAARARMRALSIPEHVIASLDRTKKAQSHITLLSPETGVISELNVRDGAMVVPGQTLAKISGLSKLWLLVEIPEAMAFQAQPGSTVEAIFSSDPTRHFTGKIREILPGISAASRTLQARLEIDNADGNLTPGMLMRVRVSASQTASRLMVPSESVITTGKRSLVIIRRDDGRLQPAEISVGHDIGDETEVLEGLGEGDTVVASGQFLIDSEASLKSVLPRLAGDAGPMEAMPQSADAQTYETTGKVEQVTPGDMTFSHQPVPALGWGAMTMTFIKPTADAFAGIKTGDTVRFSFRQTKDGYALTDVTSSGSGQ